MDLQIGEPDTATSPARPGRRRWPWIAGAAIVAAGIFVLTWFQPQKLFIDDRVDQAVPTAEPTETTTPATSAPAAGQPGAEPATTAPPAPVDVATGSFVSLDHSTNGTLRVLELEDGRRFLRLEGFQTENGPDLFVYLSTTTADGPEGTFDDDYLNLGRLQGNIGDQNYELPADTDLGRYASVVVWCDRFDSAFGAADLT